MNILQEIVNHKKQVLKKQKQEVPLAQLEKLLDRDLAAPKFKERISSGGIHLVAEVKKASPSVGIIRPDFDPVSIAKDFESGQASCVSILTEDKYFQGRLSYLDIIKKAVALPLLRKDFIVDAYQVYEAKFHQADAILLIASLLSAKEISQFIKIAEAIKLDAVLEVHDESELKKALDAGALMIGINTRNLADFSIDFKILPKILKKMPQDRLVIAESGIKTVDDLAVLKEYPIQAVLVGEALMRANDISTQTKQFVDFLKKR